MQVVRNESDDPHEDSVIEPTGIKFHEPHDLKGLETLQPAQLHPLALSLDKACQDSERKMSTHLTLPALKEEVMTIKDQLKKIIDVQEDHIEHIAGRFRLGNFTVTIRRDINSLFEDNDFCIHFRGSCDRTKNHDIHGDVSGLHLRLTLRKRISKKNPKPILSGFIYFYPNEEEPGQTGIFCRSEIDFWGMPQEEPVVESPPPEEKAKDVSPKKKSKLFGSFRSKKVDKQEKNGGAKTPSTARVPPDGKDPALSLENAQIVAEELVKPGWQKLFDMEHQYTNDGEGFGKWNVMLWEQFKKRVVRKDGKVEFRMKVNKIERYFET